MSYKKLKNEDNECRDETCTTSHAGLLSVLSFSWMSHIISEGNKRPLQESDLFENVCHVEENSTKEDTELLDRSWEQAVKRSQRGNSHPQLWKCLLRLICLKDLALYAVSLLLFSTTRVLQPIFLNYLLVELTDGDHKDTWAYWFGAAVAASSFAHLFAKASYYFTATIIATRIKSATTGLIYKKVSLLLK